MKWAARYSPFGELGPDDVNPAVDCQDPPLENPLRFPGQYDDARKGTGFFYYNLHRYYDPAVGRYTQVDPARNGPVTFTRRTASFEASASMISELGLDRHPYAYVDNDPVSRDDPDGLNWVWRGAMPMSECIPLYNEPDDKCLGCMRSFYLCGKVRCSRWLWVPERLWESRNPRNPETQKYGCWRWRARWPGQFLGGAKWEAVESWISTTCRDEPAPYVGVP